jgi:hypothetical protein
VDTRSSAMLASNFSRLLTQRSRVIDWMHYARGRLKRADYLTYIGLGLAAVALIHKPSGG